jgi:E3 ubiquitin-protein ligase HUWE1
MYASYDRLVALLRAASDPITLVLTMRLLCTLRKRHSDMSQPALPNDVRQTLIDCLSVFAESWGGKENGFGLADCVSNWPLEHYPSTATTVHLDWIEQQPTSDASRSPLKTTSASASGSGSGSSNASNAGAGQMLQHSVHIERLERLRSPPQRIMLHILMRTNVSRSKQLFLYTHIRLAQFFANYDSRLAAVYIRLAAFTCLSSLGLIASSTSSNGNNNNGSSGGIGHVFYAGLPDELVDILRLDPRTAAEPGVSHGVPNGDASPLASKARSAIYELIKTASLYALSEIAYTHPVTNRDGVVRDLVETLDAGSFHGFLPSFFRTLVQQTIDGALSLIRDATSLPSAHDVFSVLLLNLA